MEEKSFSRKLYVRTEQLKTKFGLRNSNKNYFNDANLWGELQELRKLYKKLLLSDLEYALDKKVEVDLWNLCFKDYITYLQLQVKEFRAAEIEVSQKNHGTRKTAELGIDPDITLQWFLEMASGFYILLLEEIRATFSLDMPFFNRAAYIGISSNSNKANLKSTTLISVQKEKCQYLCQYCLVHLGDISRYQNQLKQAEAFYRKAIQISPGSGQAYNQIALLHANSNNKLSAVYYYVRSVALKHPFPAASTNLEKIFTGISSSTPYIESFKVQLSKSTFLPAFLRFHALLHEARNLHAAYQLCSFINEALTSLIATESLTTLQLIQMVVISIFQLDRITTATDFRTLVSEEGENVDLSNMLSAEETIIRKLLLESIAAMLNAFLLPVYTLMQGKSFLDYFSLPATKILLDWITLNPKLLQEAGFLRRLQIWPSLCRVLNELSTSLNACKDDENSNFGLEHYPLPEDYDLQAFSPLEKRASRYHFHKVLNHRQVIQEKIRVLRAIRLLELGKEFAAVELMDGHAVLKIVTNRNDEGLLETFEAVDQGVPTDLGDILTDLEKLNLSKDYTDEETDGFEGNDKSFKKEDIAGEVAEKEASKSILKNPATLELPGHKNVQVPQPTNNDRDETVHPAPRRGQRTNVAMAAIMRQAAAAHAANIEPQKQSTAISSTKQVKFRAPSPTQGSSPEDSPHSQQSNLSQDASVFSDNNLAGAVGYLPHRTESRKVPFQPISGNNTNFSNNLLPAPPADFSVPPPSLPPPRGGNVFPMSVAPYQKPSGLGMIGPNTMEVNLPRMANNTPIGASPIRPRYPTDVGIHRQASNNIYNPHFQSALAGGSLPFPQQQRSLWPTNQQVPSPAAHSQEANHESFRHQLPHVGGSQSQPVRGIDTQAPRPSTNSDNLSSQLQFQHPYPSLTPQIRTLNNTPETKSPVYHRLFSSDPTWSVTPGSLPMNSNRAITQPSFGRPVNSISNIPELSISNETQEIANSENQNRTRNENLFQSGPSPLEKLLSEQRQNNH